MTLRVRKKPVVVTAEEITEDMVFDTSLLPQGARLVSSHLHPERRVIFHYKIIIKTREGEMEIRIGDFLMTGVHGEKYPIGRDIFFETYDIVNDEVAR